MYYGKCILFVCFAWKNIFYVVFQSKRGEFGWSRLQPCFVDINNQENNHEEDSDAGHVPADPPVEALLVGDVFEEEEEGISTSSPGLLV